MVNKTKESYSFLRLEMVSKEFERRVVRAYLIAQHLKYPEHI